MQASQNSLQKELFIKNFKEQNPSFLMGLIVISLGLYVINWIYVRNREFEHFDDNTPDSKRGMVILMILPFGWFFTMYILKNLIFEELPLVLGIMEIVTWGIIIFLILKYLYDFSHSFAEITNSNGFLWFFLFFLGIVGILSTALKFYYLTPLIFFGLITVPAMQAELNVVFKSHTIRRIRHSYYG